MDTSDLQPDPYATSYYNRLDIPQSAEQEHIEKAGKNALAEYSEAGEEKQINVKKARDTLTNSYKRYAYDTFIEKFDTNEGTKAFEDWNQENSYPEKLEEEEISPEEFIRQNSSEYVDKKDTTTDWDLIEQPVSPNIIWSKSEVGSDTEVEKYRPAEAVADQQIGWLRISNFYDEEITIDLDNGQIFNSVEDMVDDISAEVHEDGDELKLVYEDTLQIGLTNEDSESNWISDSTKIRDLSITWKSDSELNNVTVNYWNKISVSPRIYVNNFHPSGDIYIDTEEGLVYSQNSGRQIQDVTINLSDDEHELFMTHDTESIKIALFQESSTPTEEKDPDATDDNELPLDDGVYDENVEAVAKWLLDTAEKESGRELSNDSEVITRFRKEAEDILNSLSSRNYTQIYIRNVVDDYTLRTRLTYEEATSIVDGESLVFEPNSTPESEADSDTLKYDQVELDDKQAEKVVRWMLSIAEDECSRNLSNDDDVISRFEKVAKDSLNTLSTQDSSQIIVRDVVNDYTLQTKLTYEEANKITDGDSLNTPTPTDDKNTSDTESDVGIIGTALGIILVPGIYTSEDLKWRWQVIIPLILLIVTVIIQDTVSATFSIATALIFTFISTPFYVFSIPWYIAVATTLNNVLLQIIVAVIPIVYWGVVQPAVNSEG